MAKITPRQAGPRIYKDAGFSLPSVTEVLKIQEQRHLEAWRAKVGRAEADKVRTAATVFGSKIHAAAEKLMAGKGDEIDADLVPFADAVASFLEQHVAEVLATEMTLCSRRQGFAGTMDVYVRLAGSEGSHGIIDWKTSRQLTKQHGYQLAGYALLAREHDLKVNRRIAVKISKTKPGEFKVREFKDHAKDVRVFRAAVELWWALQAQKRDPLPEWDPEEIA